MSIFIFYAVFYEFLVTFSINVNKKLKFKNKTRDKPKTWWLLFNNNEIYN